MRESIGVNYGDYLMQPLVTHKCSSLIPLERKVNHVDFALDICQRDSSDTLL